MTKTAQRLLPIYVLVAALFSSLFAHGEAVDNALAKVTIVVDGMQKSKSGATWMSWTAEVSAALSELASVKNVEVNLETDEFTVTYDTTVLQPDQMLEAIVNIGFKPKIAPSRVETDGDAVSAGSDWAIPELLVSALLKADRTRKLVFIDFFAEWCGACKTLDQTTFKDPAVIKALERFVFVKIDTDLHPATAQHFKVAGMPTLVVVNITGAEIYRHVGPIEADRLSQELSVLPVEEKVAQYN